MTGKMRRNAFWVVVGLGAGVVSAYYASKAYRSARASCPPYRKRTHQDTRAMIRDFDQLWENPGEIESLLMNQYLAPQFLGKLMLAVAGAQGNTTCSRAHLRFARRVGLSRVKAESLLTGDLEYATAREAPGLFFVRHFVEREGVPEPDVLRQVVEHYEERTAHDIVTFARIVSLVNLVGNTLDALISRLLGQASQDTTLRQEVSVVLVSFFGLLPLAPILALRASRSTPVEIGLVEPAEPG